MEQWFFANAHLVLWAVGCSLAFLAGVMVLRWRASFEMRTVAALLWAWLGLMLGGVWQARLESMPFGEALLLAPADLVTSGGRLPLALATGALFAWLWCRASGAPWRTTGDALAVGATVAILFGRLGCLSAGCCTGTVCGRWAIATFCLQHGTRTEVFARQFARGLVDPASSAALPTHPLPIYFMAAAALLLATLLWQLRRDSAPGTLLITFGILWPLSKIALEQLREIPRPPLFMIGVPMVMLAASVIAWVGKRHERAPHSGSATRSSMNTPRESTTTP